MGTRRWEHFRQFLLSWLFYRDWLGEERQVLDTDRGTWTGESHQIRHWTLAFCLPSCQLVLIVYTRPPYWNSILLHLKPILRSDRDCEYYPDRWDLRLTSRFEAKIFISVKGKMCQLVGLSYCSFVLELIISLFFVEKFFPIVSKFNCWRIRPFTWNLCYVWIFSLNKS